MANGQEIGLVGEDSGCSLIKGEVSPEKSDLESPASVNIIGIEQGVTIPTVGGMSTFLTSSQSGGLTGGALHQVMNHALNPTGGGLGHHIPNVGVNTSVADSIIMGVVSASTSGGTELRRGSPANEIGSTGSW